MERMKGVSSVSREMEGKESSVEGIGEWEVDEMESVVRSEWVIGEECVESVNEGVGGG